MRFIIRQQPYERAIAAGTLRYERDGQATGALEHFRMTAAVDGYRFLRVDVDGRRAPSGRSTLYHMTLAPDDRPEQLKYRLWETGMEIAGVVSWEDGALEATRQVNDAAFEDSAAADAFWFPSATGLSLLRPVADRDEPVAAVTLEQDTAELSQAMGLRPVVVEVHKGGTLEVEVTGMVLLAQELGVTWEDQQRKVWLHDDGWPVRVWRDDGLVGKAQELILYR